ncbi:MAG: AAA family ATPase [Gammaproteobacteria bacterium]|nr:AAA family ATPase [Gammaproteobacteria bacterium]
MIQKVEFENDSNKPNDLNSDTTQKNSALLPVPDNKSKQTRVHNDQLPEISSETKIIEIEALLRNKDMLVKDSKLGPEFTNDYGRIKRPLLSNAFGKTSSLIEKGNLILVTSSIPGEGKTHTSINLALSIALERDHSVLLIDCDSTRHGTSSALNIRDNLGLVELLDNDELTIQDVILKTDIEDLFLMSSGKHHDFVTELLASQRMSALVNEMTDLLKDYLIILDAPPLLPTPQTQVLCELVGQIVFVIEAGKTPQSVVEEALNLIPEGHATGLVMNKCEGISGRSNYYYGYYSEK